MHPLPPIDLLHHDHHRDEAIVAFGAWRLVIVNSPECASAWWTRVEGHDPPWFVDVGEA